MAAAATITLGGQISSEPGGQFTIGPITITSAAANWQVQNLVLANGANTITVPSTPAPTGCIIVLDPANTAIVTLKGVAGDTGIAIGKTTKAVMLCWDPTAVPASFVLNSAALQTGFNTQIIFF